MKFVIFYILVFSLSCPLSKKRCSKANVRGFTHFNYELLTIYRNPHGDILKKIGPDEEAGYIVQIIGVKNNYFKINIGDLGLKNVWVIKGLVSLNTRNYEGQKIGLYQHPDISSDIVDSLVGEQTVKVLNACNRWAYIEGKDKNKKTIRGWLQPDMQCGKVGS